jgi:hypothetical protein
MVQSMGPYHWAVVRGVFLSVGCYVISTGLGAKAIAAIGAETALASTAVATAGAVVERAHTAGELNTKAIELATSNIVQLQKALVLVAKSLLYVANALIGDAALSNVSVNTFVEANRTICSVLSSLGDTTISDSKTPEAFIPENLEFQVPATPVAAPSFTVPINSPQPRTNIFPGTGQALNVEEKQNK